MKKRILALALSMAMAGMCLTGCGSAPSTGDNGNNGGSNPVKEMTYAVEAGSAGEEVAKEKGFKINAVASQADALMEVNAGTSDAAIIDLLMAGAMIGEGTSYPNLIHTDELTTEEYGVGCRKGSDLANYINWALADSYQNGTLKEIAEKYGVQESLVPIEVVDYASVVGGDVDYIKGKGTLIVGITDFAPMDYKEGDNWIGFDADMAGVVADTLGVEVKFVEIDWDNKIMELNSKNIDVVWNGMTLTNEVKEAMECTVPYCNNAQVVVVPAK